MGPPHCQECGQCVFGSSWSGSSLALLRSSLMPLWVMGRWHELLGGVGAGYECSKLGRRVVFGFAGAHVQQDQILIQVNNPCAEPCDGLMQRPVPTPIGSSCQSGPQWLWSPQDNGVWGGLSADERRALKPRDAGALRAGPQTPPSLRDSLGLVRRIHGGCVANRGALRSRDPEPETTQHTPVDGGSRLPRDKAIGLIRTA